MTLERLAAFAESPGGKVYRDVCERFGVDPAKPIEDDFLAFQFRLALAISHSPKDEAPEPDFDDAQRKIRELRAELGGIP